LRALLTHALSDASAAVPPAPAVLAAPALELSYWALGVVLAIACAAALAGFVQVGPLWASAAIAPDLRRAAPGERLRALLSAERWLDALLSLLKWLVLVVVAAFTLLRGARALSSFPAGDAAYALRILARLALDLLLRVGIAAMLLGSADLVLRRLALARSLRMGRSELRREQREQYGLPEQREARRRLWQQAQAHADAHALEDAAVLLCDASGRALALAYAHEAALPRAPRVLVKAQGALGSGLRLAAEHQGLPVRAAPALVAALFALEIGEEIPRAQHAAVAELLAEALPPRAADEAP
jgi:flagellar biosynthesis protein FlhB